MAAAAPTGSAHEGAAAPVVVVEPPDNQLEDTLTRAIAEIGKGEHLVLVAVASGIVVSEAGVVHQLTSSSPFREAAYLLSELTETPEEAAVWLTSPNPELADQVPLRLLAEGSAQLVIELLQDVSVGQPS